MIIWELIKEGFQKSISQVAQEAIEIILTCVTSKLVFQLTAAPHPMMTRNMVPISSATKALARSRQLSGISEYVGTISEIQEHIYGKTETSTAVVVQLQ